jgi:LPS sulfotransferase NodH
MKLLLLSTPRTGSTTMAGLLFQELHARGKCDGLLHEYFDEFYFNCYFDQLAMAKMLHSFRGASSDYFLEPGPGRQQGQLHLENGRIAFRAAARAGPLDVPAEVGRRLALLRDTTGDYLVNSHAAELTYGMIDAIADFGYEFVTLERSNKFEQILSWGIALATGHWVSTDQSRLTPPATGTLRFGRPEFDQIVWKLQDFDEKKQYIGPCRRLGYEMLAQPELALAAMGIANAPTSVPGPELAGLPVKSNGGLEEKLACFSNAGEILRWYERWQSDLASASLNTRRD